VLLTACLATGFAAGQKNDQADVQLKAAMNKELVDGDLKGAIELYQKVIAGFSGNRAVVAQALVQMGQCYEKMGQKEARSAYERVLRDFADQSAPVRLARQRLAALAPAGGAAPVVAPGMTVRRVLTVESGIEGAIDAGATLFSFTDWETGDLAIRELPSGNKRRLTNKGTWTTSPEYTETSIPSPDGRHVVYNWMGRDGTFALRVIGLDGSAARVVYDGRNSAHAYPCDWSPDGRNILAILRLKDERTSQVVTFSLEAGTQRVVATQSGGFWRLGGARFSPDGRFIAYDRRGDGKNSRFDIIAVASDGSRTTPLVQHAADDRLLDWSPDGRHVMFSSDRNGTIDAWLLPVQDGIPQGAPQVIKKDLGRITSMGIARDGAFYYGVDTGGREVYLASVDPASGKVLAAPRLVAERSLGANVAPEWSPDGKYLFYVSRRGPIGPAFNIPTIRSMETGETRELATGLSFVNQVRWSLDGRSLLCVCIDEAQKSGVCRIDARTAQVAFLGSGVFPAGVLNDQHILYVTPTKDPQTGEVQTGIWLRNLQTGEGREVVRVGNYQYGVSPDGQRLAFQATDPATKEDVVKVMPVAGGAAREVFRGKSSAMSLSWTANGRSVLVGGTDPDKEALWLVPVDGGKPLRFTVSMKGVEGPRLHPDGRQLVFYTSTPGTGEIWVMENFLPTRK